MKPNIFFKIIIWPIRLVLFFIPVIILAWLISQHLVTTGQLTVNYDLNNNSAFISQLSPQDRVSEIKKEKNNFNQQTDYYQTILAEPAYFDLTLPRGFATALVKIKFRNPEQLDFQLGAAGSPGVSQYSLKPLDNKLINNLLNDNFNWSAVQTGNTLLLQRGGRYRSVEEFLNNLPTKDRIAVHSYDLSQNFNLPNYYAQSGVEINHSLRGSLVMYTYLKKEDLDFTFTVQDVNRHPGDDPIMVNVYYQQAEPIYSQTFPDDGEMEATLEMSARRELNINLPDLKEGYYKIELPVSEDIFFRQIKTKQSLLVFANQLYLADEVGYLPEPRPATVYTDGRKLTVRTPHLEGRQTIKVGQADLEVRQVQRDYTTWLVPDVLQNSRKLTTLYSPKADILMTTKGVFSFSQASFFDPNITALSEGLDLAEEKIDFVLAEYPQQTNEAGWQTAAVSFDLEKLWLPQGRLRFVLSVPGIDEQASDKLKQGIGIDINEIEIQLTRKALIWPELMPNLKEYFLKRLDKLME